MTATVALGQVDPLSSGSIWPARGEYAGSKKCAMCHPREARQSEASLMARAMTAAINSDMLAGRVPLRFEEDGYRYEIAKKGDAVTYQVSNGTESAEADLTFAVGIGLSQTFVFRLDGRYFESRVSYFHQIDGLSLTIGASRHPDGIWDALARPLVATEVRDCFGCHSTGARRGSTLQLETYEFGVRCEACHGPGGEHVRAVERGQSGAPIGRFRALTAAQSVALCGACHRTWDMVMMLDLRGVNTVRFQPYRLSQSKCYSEADPRISCVACHNPHSALDKGDKAYDSRCAACHHAGGRKLCQVANEGCTGCHMPRYRLPGAHREFADHWIRIPKANLYPE